jgi:CBS domain-containing protein
MNPMLEPPMPTLSLRRIADAELQIPGADPWSADPHDPALTVMTDFRERASVTVSDTAAVDVALEHMKHNGVRCAFAVDDRRCTVVGLTTAYDIMSEKPMQSVHTPRREVLVRDIMLRIAEWRILTILDLESATAGSVLRLFDKSGLTHIPVMEAVDDGKFRLRGLLSAAKIRRLLSR